MAFSTLFIVSVLVVIVYHCLCCKKAVVKAEVETVDINPEYGVDYDDRESQVEDRNNYYLPAVQYYAMEAEDSE